LPGCHGTRSVELTYVRRLLRGQLGSRADPGIRLSLEGDSEPRGPETPPLLAVV
jgi:hypothetical protein